MMMKPSSHKEVHSFEAGIPEKLQLNDDDNDNDGEDVWYQQQLYNFFFRVCSSESVCFPRGLRSFEAGIPQKLQLHDGDGDGNGDGDERECGKQNKEVVQG
ncbi:hypothetical protein TIFTF001_002538 [Ficus carica]|uniref:Uncharacterized protein n=1 Tax=Ficus carica TaxID=3494 RepID=A0AA87ZN79_FICCA|nr:hypothetical protein TIFTF001_002538 [Ficus carica]